MAVELGPASRIIGPVAFAHGWEELQALVLRRPGSPAVVERRMLSSRRSARLGVPVVPVPGAAKARDAEAFESTVLQSIDAGSVTSFLERLGRRADAEGGRIAAQILSMGHRPFTVPEVAAALGLSQSTLSRRCAALGLPGAKALVSLARIFTVERLAEWSGQPSGVVAAALGFSNPSNYRRLVRRTLGAAPSAVREQGGASHLSQVLLDALAPTPAATGRT